MCGRRGSHGGSTGRSAIGERVRDNIVGGPIRIMHPAFYKTQRVYAHRSSRTLASTAQPVLCGTRRCGFLKASRTPSIVYRFAAAHANVSELPRHVTGCHSGHEPSILCIYGTPHLNNLTPQASIRKRDTRSPLYIYSIDQAFLALCRLRVWLSYIV